jgi:hypothetical protein
VRAPLPREYSTRKLRSRRQPRLGLTRKIPGFPYLTETQDGRDRNAITQIRTVRDLCVVFPVRSLFGPGDAPRLRRLGMGERPHDGVATDKPKRSEFRFSAAHHAIPGAKHLLDCRYWNDVAEQASKNWLIAQDERCPEGAMRSVPAAPSADRTVNPPNSNLWAGYRSFIDTGSNGELALIPAIRLTTIGRLKSTQSRHSLHAIAMASDTPKQTLKDD